MADSLYCNIVFFFCKELYCKRRLKGWKIVLQYKKLYCNEVPRMGWTCIAIHKVVL